MIGHTYGSTATSVPCSSRAAEVEDPPELLQHYDMVVVVVEKILSRLRLSTGLVRRTS